MCIRDSPSTPKTVQPTDTAGMWEPGLVVLKGTGEIDCWSGLALIKIYTASILRSAAPRDQPHQQAKRIQMKSAPSSHRGIFQLAALVASASVIGWTPSASAAEPGNRIVVNSLADVVANDGSCTLREAITAANSDRASGTLAGDCLLYTSPSPRDRG